jgi:hypothetical protein
MGEGEREGGREGEVGKKKREEERERGVLRGFPGA